MTRFALLAASVVGSFALAQEFKRTPAQVTLPDGGVTGEVCVTWSKRNFVYTVDAAGSERTPAETEFSAITDSFSTWQVVSDECSDFTFAGGPRVATPKVGKDSADLNVLTFRETICDPDAPCQVNQTCANELHCWDHTGRGVIAITTVIYSRRTGIISDADIEYNAADFLFTTVPSPPCLPGQQSVSCSAYDVQNTTTHEIGHVLGFDHVLDTTSTMAESAPVGETQKRIIDFGTQFGFCGTYPRQRPPVPCDEIAQVQRRVIAKNVGTFGCSCDGAPGATSVVLLAVLGLVRRRRTRR